MGEKCRGSKLKAKREKARRAKAVYLQLAEPEIHLLREDPNDYPTLSVRRQTTRSVTVLWRDPAARVKREISRISIEPWFVWEVRLSPTATKSLPTPATGIRRQHPGPIQLQLYRPSLRGQIGLDGTCGSRIDNPVASRLFWCLTG